MMSCESGLAQPQVTVSIVSHGHGLLVAELLNDLGGYSSKQIDVILTINVEEDLPFKENDYNFPLTIVRNTEPRGFGANHNAAFSLQHGEYFCVLNPDIRFNTDPFGPLLQIFSAADIGIAAPLVRSAVGSLEDSARRLPTPLTILRKIFDRRLRPDYPIGTTPFNPDWVAGMFMLFRSETYARMSGFDERYFLYYEDVDLCARMTLAGYKIILDPQVSVTHDARRESHRNLAYFRRHVASIVRFFLSRVFFRHMLRRAWSRKETSS